MRFGNESELFGKEKDDSFRGSIGNIYQAFGGQELYPSLEEAAGDVNLKSSVSIIQAIQRDKTAGGYHWRYATDDEIKEWQCSHGKK